MGYLLHTDKSKYGPKSGVHSIKARGIYYTKYFGVGGGGRRGLIKNKELGGKMKKGENWIKNG